MSSSKSMLLRVILCLVILLFVTAHGKQRYCGSLLTKSLSILCRNNYASPINNDKRSGDSNFYGYINDESLADTSPFSYEMMPFSANLDSSAALRPRMRRNYWYQGGVFDECCRKPCSIDVLMGYCGA